jgi:hypothetical protein
MARKIPTRKLLLQHFSAAIIWGAVGPLAAILWHDGVTREPNALAFSILISAVTVRIAPRVRYTGTVLATLGAAAVFVSTYIASERIARLLGAPPPWLPNRNWLALWSTAILAVTLAVRYSIVVARARRIRTRRSPALAA